MLSNQLILIRYIGRLWDNTLLLQHLKDAHLCPDQINRRLQVRTEAHHLPHNALLRVLLLLQHKHEVIEKLLQPLIRKVNAQLLEAIVLEGLEASDVQHTNEKGPLDIFNVQRDINHLNQPVEQPAINSLAESTDAVCDLRYILALVDKVIPHFDPGLCQAFEQLILIKAEKGGHAVYLIGAVEFGLFFARLLFPLAVAEEGDGGCCFEELDLLVRWKEEHVEGHFGVFHFLAVVHAVNG